MKNSERISTGMAVVARMLLRNLPLLLLWTIALAMPAVGDLPKLWHLEYPTLQYVLGLLRIMTCSVALAVLVACAIAAIAQWRPLRWLLAVVAVLMLGTYAFLQINYGTRLSPEIYSFINGTTWTEATEFLLTYLARGNGLWLAIAMIVAIVLWIIIDTRWHRLGHEPSLLITKVVNSLLLAAVVGAACAPSTWSLAKSLVTGEKKQYNDSFGLDVISNMMFCHQALRYTDELTLESIASTRKAIASPARCEKDAPTVVLVIGESYIKSHAGIYGYPLPTTPCMSEERDAGRLWVFDDAVSAFNNTNMSMRVMLSLNSIYHGEQWQDKPLVAAVFKSAGYQVELLDNQRDFFTGSDYTRGLNGFIYHPEVVKLCYSNLNSRNFTYDGEIVDYYATAAASREASPQLVIFHLRGQHIMASKRYPHGAGFDSFTIKDYQFRKEPFLTEYMRQEIAYYDNATLYNDHVIGKIFEVFAKKDAVVVYLSDHGEEIYDYRPSVGRIPAGSGDLNNQDAVNMLRYQFGVPLVVWCSRLFMERHPDKVERIAKSTARRISTDNIGQMLLGIAGIDTPYYVPEQDATSTSYEIPDRVVNFNIKYDFVTQKYGQKISK